MALPSGTFNSPRSGKLSISFSGVWKNNNSDPWGGGNAGGNDISLKGFAGAASCQLNRNVTSATIELDYTANTNVSVGMTEISHTISGASVISASQLRIRCRLMKK